MERRLSFGSVAARYDAARPSYPESLVADVLAHAALGPGDAILELGAGTGKATRMFAAATPGQRLVALEPSPEMAALAARHADEVVTSDFEAWAAPQEAFGLLICAQAWHWLDPATRFDRCRSVLAPGGTLAVFWNRPTLEPAELRAALDAVYSRVAPELAGSIPMRGSRGEPAERWTGELPPAFCDGELRAYRWTRTVTTAEYLELLGTYSDHIVLEPAVGARLGEAIARELDGAGGSVTLAYRTLLCLARRRSRDGAEFVAGR
jgi:SAM-dependent methyltransferase